MKGAIVYYSGGGNTKKIATSIHKGMKKVIDADVFWIKDVNPKDMANYDLVAIGSPNWFFRETANIREFIYYMPDMTGKLGLAFFSCGGEAAFHSMIPPMQRKGLAMIGWNRWTRGNSYYTLHAVPPFNTALYPDEADKKDAEEWGRQMAERALRVSAGEKDLIPKIPTAKENPAFKPHGMMRFFPDAQVPHRKINMGKCKYSECTLCIDNCDSHAFDFSVSPPTIKYPCLNCCLCDRLCPTGAIEIDEAELRQIRPMKKIDMTKCKYPECTICLGHCSMDAIDFSQSPPVFSHRCEGDDLCWVICPEGAIEIDNLETTHRQLADYSFDPANKLGWLRDLDRLKKYGLIMDMKRTPRFDIHELMKDDD